MNFENIKKWAELPLKLRYNIVLALIVVTLCSVVIYYEKKVNKKDEDHRTVVNNLIVRYRSDKAVLEAKLEVCNENFNNYLRENEKEYKELLFQAKRLKEQIDENAK